MSLPLRTALSPPTPSEDAVDTAIIFFRMANEASREAIYQRRRQEAQAVSLELAGQARFYRSIAVDALCRG